MKLSLKDRAKARYHSVKASVANGIGALEKRVGKLDDRLSAKAAKRGKQLAGKLERAAARVRRSST